MKKFHFDTALPLLDSSWREVMGPEFHQPYMKALNEFLSQQIQAGKVIYPAIENWFNAFNLTPFDKVNVIILGQDPYHGPDQAHGLCFSVPPAVAIPPSLMNIFKELEQDMGMPRPKNGCLQPWATKGVLLLNATLTVEQGKAGSHQGKGWEHFTDKAIQLLSERRKGLVFLLWGAYAHRKESLIDTSNHLVLKAPHPSPLSAYRGFFGCRHFSLANAYLLRFGQQPVDWRL